MAAKLLQAAHRFRPLWVSLTAVYIYVLEKVTKESFPRILLEVKRIDVLAMHKESICPTSAMRKQILLRHRLKLSKYPN
jgi:hypothetical protein